MLLKQKFLLNADTTPPLTAALHYAIREDYPKEENFRTIPTTKFSDSTLIKSYFGCVQLYNTAFEEFIEANHPSKEYLMISGSGHYNEFRRIGDRIMEYNQFISRLGAQPSVDPNEKQSSYMQRKYVPSDYIYNIAAIVVIPLTETNKQTALITQAMNTAMQSQADCNAAVPINYLTLPGYEHRRKINPIPFACITITGIYDKETLFQVIRIAAPALLQAGVMIIEYLQAGYEVKLSETERRFAAPPGIEDPRGMIYDAFTGVMAETSIDTPDTDKPELNLGIKIIPEAHGIFGLAIVRFIDAV